MNGPAEGVQLLIHVIIDVRMEDWVFQRFMSCVYGTFGLDDKMSVSNIHGPTY